MNESEGRLEADALRARESWDGGRLYNSFR